MGMTCWQQRPTCSLFVAPSMIPVSSGHTGPATMYERSGQDGSQYRMQRSAPPVTRAPFASGRRLDMLASLRRGKQDKEDIPASTDQALRQPLQSVRQPCTACDSKAVRHLLEGICKATPTKNFKAQYAILTGSGPKAKSAPCLYQVQHCLAVPRLRCVDLVHGHVSVQHGSHLICIRSLHS